MCAAVEAEVGTQRTTLSNMESCLRKSIANRDAHVASLRENVLAAAEKTMQEFLSEVETGTKMNTKHIHDSLSSMKRSMEVDTKFVAKRLRTGREETEKTIQVVGALSQELEQQIEGHRNALLSQIDKVGTLLLSLYSPCRFIGIE